MSCILGSNMLFLATLAEEVEISGVLLVFGLCPLYQPESDSRSRTTAYDAVIVT